MNAALHERFERLALRLAELDATLADPAVAADAQRWRTLAREQAQAQDVVGRWRRWQQRERDIDTARGLLAATAADDAEMAAMARQEITDAEAEMQALEQQLQAALLPRDPDDERNAFVEIRAGTGGDEAALFAGDLLRMILRWCERQGWRCEVLSESPAELGGFKDVVLRVEGTGEGVGPYGRLRFESGGHRVQRVPATESQGRIHTSACTIAVLPEPEAAEAVRIDPSALRIDTYRASGAGGQHVNKTDSAVRITHLPTGLVAECQDDRSQHRNRAKAMAVLVARLAERERSAREAQEAATRKRLIGSGDRSDRIRTYNFPQGRVTDHRINLTLHRLGAVLDGDLDELNAALRQARVAEQLEALQAGA
jgi:peptide chain release factor 1